MVVVQKLIILKNLREAELRKKINNFFRKNTKPIQELRSSKLDIELKKLNEENMPVRVMLPYTTVEL